MSKGRKHPHRSAIPNNVARGMILGETGKGGPMKDRRERRSKDARRSWKREEWGYTSVELMYALCMCIFWGAIVLLAAHLIHKWW